MSVFEEGMEYISNSSNGAKVDLLKSPARLLAHLEKNNGNESLKDQILEAAQWILCSPEAIGFSRLTALCYEVPTKLQDGPQCGIVALWMASNALLRTITDNKEEVTKGSNVSAGDFPSVDWIQNMAKVKQFSRKGEMFSSDNLALLAEVCFQHFLKGATLQKSLTSYVVKNDVYSLLTSYERMVDFFTDTSYHQVLLVPYDSDHDQRPCRKRGHKAHWCIISGIAAFISSPKLSNAKSMELLNSYIQEKNDNDQSQSSNNNDYVEIVDDSSKVVIITKSKMLSTPYPKLNEILNTQILNKKHNTKTGTLDDDESSFYLIAKQSKSKRTFLFDPHQLAKSNQNLVEVYADQQMVQSDDKYIIPPGGLREGLANQVIVLKLQV